MNKKILMFGGTGGLGCQIIKLLNEDYEVRNISSKECDIGNNACVKILFDGIEEFDYLINFAIINSDGLVHKQDSFNVANQIRINILGAINILKFAIPIMRKKGGKIIFMSSYLSNKPLAGTGVYSACKSFIDNIVKTVSLENAKYNITCNSIQAGYFEGGLAYKIPEKLSNELKEKIPMKRFGTIFELHKAIEFILKNDYVIGTNLLIDGGISLV